MSHARGSGTGRRRPRGSSACVLTLGLLAALASAGGSTACGQGFGMTYYNNPGMVSFPLVNFPLVDFPMVSFPLVNTLGPVQNYGVYYGYGSPYYNPNPDAYWNSWAAADTYGAAKYAMTSARFNVATASMATNAAASNLIARDEYAMMLQRRAAAMRGSPSDRYSVQTGSSTFVPGQSGSRKLSEVTSNEGDVLWPLFAPAGDLFDRRQAAGQAIRSLVQAFKKDGKLPVEDVVSALKALHAYATPAAESLRKSQPDQVPSFVDFIASLDQGARALAAGPVPDAP
jgi:hypothetical protein